MTDRPPPDPEPRGREPVETEIDTSVAHPARVRNFLAGGEANFNADRKAAEHAAGDMPGGMDLARATVRSLGGFMIRAVQHLVSEHGVDQYLHIGTPIPTAEDVHVVAQRVVPQARIVYVGDDPVVMAHAHSLRRGSPSGAASYIHGTLGDPQRLLDRSAETLDLSRPIAVLLIGTLAFVPDKSDPWGITTRLLDALTPGSCLVLAHTSDLYEGIVEAGERLSETLKTPFVVRSRAKIVRFFDGLELLDPGLVQIDKWHRSETPPALDPGAKRWPVPILAGIGRKPSAAGSPTA